MVVGSGSGRQLGEASRRALSGQALLVSFQGVDKRTAAWRWFDEYFVEVFGSEPVTPQEWSALVAEIAAHKSTIKGVLAISGGGAPSSRQRAELAAAIKGTDFPAAVLTDSALGRAALSAMALFVKGRARGFALGQLQEGLDYLKVPEFLRGQIGNAIKEMQQELRA